jgi:hypothetical protein
MKPAIVLLALGLAGCQFATPPTAGEAVKIAGSMRYFTDPRTLLCFAAVQSIVQAVVVVSISNVPCSPEVLALSKREAQ